jgi:uncharacterized tellurite resistance protein B-like protein
MAHADGEFHETEVNVVREKMKKLFPHDDNPEKRLKEAMALYDDFDKNQLRILIRDTFSQFSEIKFPVKYHIYADMYDIINADGKVDESETHAISMLKEIIDISH